MASVSRSFDPNSPGARQLARTWLPRLELWEMRLTRQPMIHGDRRLDIGDLIELPAADGKAMVGDGLAELVGRRMVSAHE